MAESTGRAKAARQLPNVLAATLLVLVLPSLGIYFLETSGIISSSITSILGSIVLSILLAQIMSRAWMRHPGSKDLVFGDLMLWGWLRRIRTEKKLSDAMRILGVDRAGHVRNEIFMSPKRQAEVLTELAAALEAGDPFTHGHSRRVTRFAHMIAKTMRLSPAQVSKIRTAAAVHDVGKVETPSEILLKPGSLTDEEFAVMKQHPVTGARMVERLGDSEITDIVRHHHERMDGRGYPDALRGDEIPIGARVVAVADTFDAITSARPYRHGRNHAEAIEILKRASGNQLDPEVVDAFLAYYSGKRALTLWMSLSNALQRIVGGFGNWVQQAQAGGFAAGTASLGAAVTMTAVLGGVMPAVAHGRHHQREAGEASVAAAFEPENGAVTWVPTDRGDYEDDSADVSTADNPWADLATGDAGEPSTTPGEEGSDPQRGGRDVDPSAGDAAVTQQDPFTTVTTEPAADPSDAEPAAEDPTDEPTAEPDDPDTAAAPPEHGHAHAKRPKKSKTKNANHAGANSHRGGVSKNHRHSDR